MLYILNVTECTKKSSAEHLHRFVPPDWYISSMQKNFLQRYWHRKRFSAMRTLAEAVKGTVFDIGSADGLFSFHILQATKAASLQGIDVLESSVTWAKNHWKQYPMTFSVGDAHRLDVADNQYDIVTCMEALEHVHNPAEVLSEIYRITKPSGYCLVMTPTDSWLFQCIWWMWTKTRGAIWQDTHLHSFTGHKLASAVSKAGFVIEKDCQFLFGMLCIVKGRKTARGGMHRSRLQNFRTCS